MCSKTEKQHFKGAESVGDNIKGVEVQLRHSSNAGKFEVEVSKCLLKVKEGLHIAKAISNIIPMLLA